MAQQRQTREQLGVQSGDSIVIKGKVAFARLDKLVEGEALAKENQRRAQHNMMSTKPFRSVTIEDPEVIQGQGTALANFYAQHVYPSKSTGKQTMSFESKSLYPPQYGHIQNGKIVEIADPQRNPAQGQEIYLMITAFKAKGFTNLGSSFNAIVFPEGEIKFYEGNNSLTGFGQALNMPVETLPQAQPEPIAPDATPDTSAGFGGNTGQGFGQPNQEQANPNAGQGFGQPQANPAQEQGGFGGFGQPQANPAQTGQGFGGQPQTQAHPFGLQDSDVNTNPNSNPFGNGAGVNNDGQGINSPFA